MKVVDGDYVLEHEDWALVANRDGLQIVMPNRFRNADAVPLYGMLLTACAKRMQTEEQWIMSMVDWLINHSGKSTGANANADSLASNAEPSLTDTPPAGNA